MKKILRKILQDKKQRRYTLVCVGIAVSISVLQPYLTGKIYTDAQAVDLLQGVKESSLYFGSAIATASASILALMLTLLSVTHQSEISFSYSTYRGIRLIGAISTATFIGAVMLLLALSFPIGEFQTIDDRWFKGLYYTLSIMNGLLAGLMIIGVLVLFDTITTLIKELSPDMD